MSPKLKSSTDIDPEAIAAEIARQVAEGARLAAEQIWLDEHVDDDGERIFDEKPMSMREFLGPRGLNGWGPGVRRPWVRDSIAEHLINIFGEEVDGVRIAKYPEALITGGIGIGKTTIASIVLSYMVHWVMCLKAPYEFFDMAPGTKIAFMQMSTSEDQARQVIFNDIESRIKHSTWFKDHPMDPGYKKQIRFPEKDIWIIPGDSGETTFEGYNILGGVLDEMDSHKVTEKGDYADLGYDTISNRIKSRYGDRGFFILIGQMKKSVGFAARKYKEFKARHDAYVAKMTIWESFGDEYYRCHWIGPHEHNRANPEGVECGQVHKFAYDLKRKVIVETREAEILESSENIMWIPVVYQREFEINPEKALRDLAGIPPIVGDPFISLVGRIIECRDRWVMRYNDGNPNPGPGGVLSPVNIAGQLEPWFHPLDSMKRVGHIDMAFSAEGDALGFAMGHVAGVVDIDGEKKPYIIIDLLLRMHAVPGSEIELAQVRHFIYALRDMGFKFGLVSMDGFQSTDTRQQLTKKRISSSHISVDKDLTPYYDLRDAIYEQRIDIPAYMVHIQHGDVDLVEIAVKELSELVDNGKKIDHPDGGSKDVADCIAAITYSLMGDRTYHRKVTSLDSRRRQRAEQRQAVNGYPTHPAFNGMSSINAPRVPNWSGR